MPDSDVDAVGLQLCGDLADVGLSVVIGEQNLRLNRSCGIQQLAGDATMLYYFLDEAQEGGRAFLEKRKPDFDQYPQIP